MSKRFNGLLLMGVLASLLVFVGCSEDNEIEASDLISQYGVSNSTWFAFTDVAASAEYSWNSPGFSDPGSGVYEQVAVSGTGQFSIVLTSGHQDYATYDQTQVDITYIDLAGVTWENVAGEDFSVTLYDWTDAGGKVSGVFSGTLQQLAGTDLKEIANGTFKLNITN